MSKAQPSRAALDRGPDPRVVRSRQAALSAVQELLAEGFECLVASARCSFGLAVNRRGQHEREQCRAKHDGGDGKVPPSDEEEDGDGRADRDRSA